VYLRIRWLTYRPNTLDYGHLVFTCRIWNLKDIFGGHQQWYFSCIALAFSAQIFYLSRMSMIQSSPRCSDNWQRRRSGTAVLHWPSCLQDTRCGLYTQLCSGLHRHTNTKREQSSPVTLLTLKSRNFVSGKFPPQFAVKEQLFKTLSKCLATQARGRLLFRRPVSARPVLWARTNHSLSLVSPYQMLLFPP
jgi:hypothetical protein